MNRKQLPLILVLVAGSITTLTVYFKGLGLTTMLIALLAVIIVFYFLGSVIKLVLDSFDKKNENAVSDEGEVIEKESDEELNGDEEKDESEENIVQ